MNVKKTKSSKKIVLKTTMSMTASYPSLIVDGQLGVLVLVNGQVLVEQDLSQQLE